MEYPVTVSSGDDPLSRVFGSGGLAHAFLFFWLM